MDKKKLIGVLIFVIIVIFALLFYFTPLKKVFFKDQNNISDNDKTDIYSKPKSIKIIATDGYKLEKINLDGEEVPLIKIPLVTWGGYASLFAANNGAKPNKNSLFYKYGKFAVELIHQENPIDHINSFAKGDTPIIWSTMDMMPLLYDALKNDKRIIPQVFGVFDWSFGGDGIVVRGNVKSPKDLKGKKIVTSGNTPSNFFLLWVLAQSDLKPSDVMIQYTDDAFLAKEAYMKNKNIDACVTWSPFIYELTDPKSKSYIEGSKLLITSKDANQLIADCYIARVDFIKEHPEMLEAFSKAMMEGYDVYNANKEKIYTEIAEFFKLPGASFEASLMLQDVHLANFPENLMFFDLDNSINSYKIFFLSQEYYKNLGSLSSDANYEAEMVIYKKALETIKAKSLFANQKNTIKNSFNKDAFLNITDLESNRIVLAEDLQIHFSPQKIDFDINQNSDEIVQNKKLLKKIADQMDILGTTVVKLIGHLDTSKVEEYKSKGMQVYLEASSQAKLISKKRAEFIKKILIDVYKCDADRIITEGKGWDMPIDNTDQDKNRRVEVRFFAFE